MNLKQCRFRRDNAETVAWIDERGAKIGAKVELLTADGQFWTVTEVYAGSIDEKTFRAQQALNRNSLPSILPKDTVTA